MHTGGCGASGSVVMLAITGVGRRGGRAVSPTRDRPHSAPDFESMVADVMARKGLKSFARDRRGPKRSLRPASMVELQNAAG